MYEGRIQVLASEQMKSSGGGLTNYFNYRSLECSVARVPRLGRDGPRAPLNLCACKVIVT